MTSRRADSTRLMLPGPTVDVTRKAQRFIANLSCFLGTDNMLPYCEIRAVSVFAFILGSSLAATVFAQEPAGVFGEKYKNLETMASGGKSNLITAEK